MDIRNVCVVIAFLLAAVTSSIAQSNVRARIDFRTLFCKNTTGDEPLADEPYLKIMRILPGSAPSFATFDGGSVRAGEYAWDGDARKIIWEGNLAPGEAAAFIVNVMEEDQQAPTWMQWLNSGTQCAPAVLATAATAGAAAPGLLNCAGVVNNIVDAVNGDDLIGQFTITVKNNGGALEKSLHTFGPRTQIGAYGRGAQSLSESGKTIRIRCGQGTQHQQKYQASIQVRNIPNILVDESGDALKWTISGRDDAT